MPGGNSDAGDADGGMLWRSAVVVVLAGGVVGFCLASPRPKGGGEAGLVMGLPERVLAYRSEAVGMSDLERQALPEDTEIERRRYLAENGSEVHCTIVLSGAEKRSIHRPEACLPAQGWEIRYQRVVPLVLEDGRPMEVMELAVRHRNLGRGGQGGGGIPARFAYWFVGRGVVTPHHYRRLFLTTWDLVFHNVSHRWAYVSVLSPALAGYRSPGRTEAEVEADVRAFVRAAGPAFMKPVAGAGHP